MTKLNIESSRLSRVLELYEKLSLPCDVIAEELGISEIEVKKILSSEGSAKFKMDVALGTEEWLADEEMKDIYKQYIHLAKYSENDSVREKAMRFLIEEKNGRNERRVTKEVGREEEKPNMVKLLNESLGGLAKIVGGGSEEVKM